MLRNLFQVKNECIPIENFNINGDVRSIQRLSLVIMIHCREIVRRNYNYFKTVTLTLCDASAKTLSGVLFERVVEVAMTRHANGSQGAAAVSSLLG